MSSIDLRDIYSDRHSTYFQESYILVRGDIRTNKP